MICLDKRGSKRCLGFKASGFFMLEMIIALSIFALIMSYVLSFSYKVVRQCMRLHDHVMLDDQIRGANVVLERTLRGAPSLRTAWLKTTPSSIIWRHSDGSDWGWDLVKESLVFIKGKYDVTSGQWKSRQTSVVAAHINNVEFTVYSKKTPLGDVRIIAIKYHVSGSCARPGMPSISRKAERLVSLSNRLIVRRRNDKVGSYITNDGP